MVLLCHFVPVLRKFGVGSKDSLSVWTFIHRSGKVMHSLACVRFLTAKINLSNGVFFMKIYRRILMSLCGVSTLALAACGEGYEVVEFRGQVPYTEERTAGPGVAYVLAHMMPAKTVVLPAQGDNTIKDAEPIFDKKVRKK